MWEVPGFPGILRPVPRDLQNELPSRRACMGAFTKRTSPRGGAGDLQNELTWTAGFGRSCKTKPKAFLVKHAKDVQRA